MPIIAMMSGRNESFAPELVTATTGAAFIVRSAKMPAVRGGRAGLRATSWRTCFA